jgi:hypothetical protein
MGGRKPQEGPPFRHEPVQPVLDGHDAILARAVYQFGQRAGEDDVGVDQRHHLGWVL